MKLVKRDWSGEDFLIYREISDFPQKGVSFIDFTPTLVGKDSLNKLEKGLYETINRKFDWNKIDLIISPEARGFFYAPLLASKYNVGFIPMRKPGKLPDDLVYKINYSKEYGTDTLCVPKPIDNADFYKSKNILFIDDVYATGGTFSAAKSFCDMVGANLLGGIVLTTVLDCWKNEDKLSSLYTAEL